MGPLCKELLSIFDASLLGPYLSRYGYTSESEHTCGSTTREHVMVTLTFNIIKYVHLVTTCPKCGEETGVDKGHCTPSQLLAQEKFWCDKCEENFTVDVDWGSLVNDAIKAATGAV